MAIRETFKPRFYGDLIDIFQAACDLTGLVQYFNWGELEDLDVKTEGLYVEQLKNQPWLTETRGYVNFPAGSTFSTYPAPNLIYPYVFLNPFSLQIIQGYNQHTCNLYILQQPAGVDRNAIIESLDESLKILQTIFAVIKNTTWRNSPRADDLGGVLNPVNDPLFKTGTGVNKKLSVDASLDYPINVVPLYDFGNMGAYGFQATFTINMRNPLDLTEINRVLDSI